MLVNLEEFNDGLPARGSESKLQMSITAYYIAHMKGATRTVETRNPPRKCPQTHKYSDTRICTTHTHKCAPDVHHCLGWLVDMTVRSGYTTFV